MSWPIGVDDGESRENATPRQHSGLQRVPEIARGIRQRPGSLERASSGDLSVSLGRKGNRRRTPSLAGEVRASLRRIAETCAELRAGSFHELRKENFMNDTERTTLFFLLGLGIGVGVALFFAPRSGEETREWLADKAEREFRMLRRSGRRSMRQLQATVTKGQDILRDGKEALAAVAARLG